MKRIMNHNLYVLIFFIAGCSGDLDKTSHIALETRMDTVSYIIGLDYGTGIREQNIDANRLAIFKGIADGLDGKSVLSDSAKNALIDDFNGELKRKLEREGRLLLEQNRAEGHQFLEENRSKNGVVELSNGLQYKVLKQGSGPRPEPADSVIVHYRAMYIDREVFDMSYDRGPAGIRLNTVIKGLSEGIQLMNQGAIYELYMPPELAYGDVVFANVIPAGSTLIYTIELIEIVK